MAYNPFNIFRRNQKALFAVLTVFIMIMFTLQSGVAGGDFFETFARWMGGSAGETLCKIDGSKITSRDLHAPGRGTEFKRRMANRFMALAADQITRTLEAYIVEQQPRLGPEGKDTANQAMEVLSMMRRPQFAGLVVQELPLLAANMTQRIESPTAKSEDKELARAVQVLYQLLYKLALGGGSQYFLNAPNRNDRDLIEFKLWEKKADQLGIKFTRDDVARLIQAEFYGFHKSDVEIRKAMASMQGFTIEACMDAIADEFKVRAAQTAVLGQMSRYHRAPAFGTPYEAFEYYREQCSTAVYEVLPVPASAFLNKVSGEPTEAELNDLYNKYQNDEPNPKSETPGFKEPRKISVSWLGITGEEPYYKKLAEEQVKVGEVMARASGALTVPLPGGLAAWAAGAAAPLSLKDPAIAAAYETYTNQFKFQVRNEYSSSSLFARDVLPSSVVRPGVLAATAGGFIGQTAGFGNPIAAVAVSMAAPIGYEIRDRVKVGMPLVLGFTPGPAMIPTLVGGAAASSASDPKPLPADFMRPELIKTAIDSRAKALAFGGSGDEKGDVTRFTEELDKLSDNGKPKDKAAAEKAEKYIQDFIAKRGLTQFGKSTAPRDEWTIEDDPGLLPLVLAQKESLRSAGKFHAQEYIPFGQSFFWSSVPEQAGGSFRMRRGPATSGLYQAQKYPPNDFSSRDGKAQYVVWRTEDLPARKTVRAAAMPAVKAAWKRMKARELAQAYANGLADRIRAYEKADPVQLNQFLADRAFEFQRDVEDPKARLRAKPFEVSGVAPLVPGAPNPMMMMQGGGTPLQPFDLRESENLPYPTAEMRTALIDNRDKPAKTVLVLPDAPKDTYYVATLLRRDLKTPEDFRFNVYSRFGSAPMVRQLYQEDAMKKSRQSVLDLLKKEFRYEETEEQKKKLDENAKSGNRDRD